jgi:hypothetical protein
MLTSQTVSERRLLRCQQLQYADNVFDVSLTSFESILPAAPAPSANLADTTGWHRAGLNSNSSKDRRCQTHRAATTLYCSSLRQTQRTCSVSCECVSGPAGRCSRDRGEQGTAGHLGADCTGQNIHLWQGDVGLSCCARPAASNTLALCVHLCECHVAQLLRARSKHVPQEHLASIVDDHAGPPAHASPLLRVYLCYVPVGVSSVVVMVVSALTRCVVS